MVATILEKIVAHKQRELARMKREVPLASLYRSIDTRRPPLDFAAAMRAEGLQFIAEIKKASPSRGLLRPNLDAPALARTYAANGAAAISVLTESEYFRGSLEDLAAVRREVDVPVLRKDFIFDEYQVYETASAGADALLLITAILDGRQLEGLLGLSQELGLDCLVEVHCEEELKTALLAGAGIIGINNRNLDDFTVDTNTTRRLRLLIPNDTVVVSESGIGCRTDVRKMKECRVDAVLVGEALVTAADIPAKIREMFP